MAKKNVVVIGYGGMGGWHTRAICGSKLENDGYQPPKGMEDGSDCVNLKGVYDIKEERQELARERGLYAYPSFEAVLADPEVDILTLAVPNDVHKDLAIRAMAAGKNVISEKPVTLSSADLQEMIDASEKYGKLFTVHQNRRWDEDFLAMKEVYESGKLGYVFNIESRVHGSRGIPGDWRNTKRQGGGMILDWGVHLLDQILQLVDEPIVSVHCEVQHVTNDEVDDGFICQLTFGSGLVAHVEVGTSHFIALPRWYVLGENGSCQIDDFALHGRIVKVSDWEKRDAVPVVTAAGLTKTMAPRTEDTIKTYPLPEVKSDVRDYYRNVARAVRGEEKQIVTHAQILRAMKLMEALFRSAEDDCVVHTRI